MGCGRHQPNYAAAAVAPANGCDPSRIGMPQMCTVRTEHNCVWMT